MHKKIDNGFMDVTVHGNIATVRMSMDDLMTLRYALNEGAEKLDQIASYRRRINPTSANSITETAERAKVVNVALETAVQDWVRDPRIKRG